MAVAGLSRLDRAADGFLGELVPAAGQGALAIEGRAGPWPLDGLADREATACVTAERELTRTLGATCNTPVGAHARLVADGELELSGWVGRPDGSAWIRDTLRGAAQGLGRAVAERLIAVGAEELLR